MEIAFFYWYSGCFKNIEYAASRSSPLRFLGSPTVSTHSSLVYCSYSANLHSVCTSLVSKSSLTLELTLLLLNSLSSSFISLACCLSSLISFSYYSSSCLWCLTSSINSCLFILLICFRLDGMLRVVAGMLRFPISS